MYTILMFICVRLRHGVGLHSDPPTNGRAYVGLSLHRTVMVANLHYLRDGNNHSFLESATR